MIAQHEILGIWMKVSLLVYPRCVGHRHPVGHGVAVPVMLEPVRSHVSGKIIVGNHVATSPVSLSTQILCRRKRLGPANKSSTRSMHHTQDTGWTNGCHLDAPCPLCWRQQDRGTFIKHLIFKPDLTLPD